MLHALRSSRCGELSFDVATAALSMADIVADIAVTVEFAKQGRYSFFALSLGIFCLAQACYAFLFSATYGSHLSNLGKTCTFLLALPFAQLVPVFTLVESFHLKSVGAALRSAGLRPTSTEFAPAAESDSLWQLLQRKYHAHAGFIIEALVEAIPQCALQIAAVVLARESSALNVFSILLSLAVIGSKGWLAAYSLHRPTFVFNSLCIAADVYIAAADLSTQPLVPTSRSQRLTHVNGARHVLTPAARVPSPMAAGGGLLRDGCVPRCLAPR
jgi:hypothetical protein